MRAIQVPYAGGPLELVERDLPEPGPGEVRVRVQACGVCHSDASAKQGGMAGQRYPIVPGHEIAGVIDALGPAVTGWSVGQRVGLGWFAGACGRCTPCRRGQAMACRNLEIHGVTRDGGYAEFVVGRADALALIPDHLSAVEAAPMLCAGVTTYNALRRCGARPGAVVAILGLGGLGHLALQFASRMGYRTVVVARGPEKAALAARLGAASYVDSTRESPARALAALGGAEAIIATATDAAAISSLIDGLTIDGRLIVVGVPHEPITVYAYQLLYGRSLTGSAGGVAIESEDAMAFSAASGVRPLVETLPLERAAEAYERMMAGEARLRVVLTMGAS